LKNPGRREYALARRKAPAAHLKQSLVRAGDWEVPATPEDLVFKLVDITNKAGNYLLNVGQPLRESFRRQTALNCKQESRRTTVSLSAGPTGDYASVLVLEMSQ
jgi:hypothetical protein